MRDTIAGQTVYKGDVIYDRGKVVGVWGGERDTYKSHSDPRIIRSPSEIWSLALESNPTHPVEAPTPLEDLALGKGLRDYMEAL